MAAEPVAVSAAQPRALPREKAITEDEAKLYDRQLRLWGAAAQARMLASNVLFAGRFRGVAVDAVKNIVLAGIGSLALLDGEDLQEEDLGANYFVREDERVEASAPRIQALNPRVNLTTETNANLLFDETYLQQFDLVVMTDVDAPTVLAVNDVTRRLGKKLFAAGSMGLDGWMFADLLAHDFIVDKHKMISPGETVVVPTQVTLDYVPFSAALEHKFGSLKKRELKRTGTVLWGALALFAAQRDAVLAPVTTPQTVEVDPTALSSMAKKLLPEMGVSADLLPAEEIERIATLQSAEFAPTCAIVGGILGQDVLNAVGGKEEPVRNLLVYEGQTGQARVWGLGV
ncbi:E1 ubiquitin-activating protein aos1 [Rhodotorula sphaerocarpa]